MTHVPIVLSAHPEVVLRERGLLLEWVEAAVRMPELVMPDPTDPSHRKDVASPPSAIGID
jgi:hypothetical protein